MNGMSETTLWIIESLVFGTVFGGMIVMSVWMLDIRDRERKREDELMTAYEDGIKEGGRLRFRERCEIERRCRELENMIQEEKKK